MTSIKNMATLLAAISTFAPQPTPIPQSNVAQSCGEVNVFYTGFPPYHPLVVAQGWDPLKVEIGLRNDTYELVKAGYNVHVVWAGTEIPVDVVAARMDQSGVEFDATAIGFGIRGATMPAIVERFERLVEMYQQKAPNARRLFNYSPDSTLWSVTHRFPLKEDCVAANKPGKLLGYEEICDTRCDIEKKHYESGKMLQQNSQKEGQGHYEL